jgi:GcrA cell cycle regulator
MAASARAVQGNTALAIADATAEALQPARAPEEVVVPLSLKVTIVELRESMCRWPIGDPSSVEFRYCGSPAHIGTPYCQYHGKIAYQPAQERRRERDRERRPMLAR